MQCACSAEVPHHGLILLHTKTPASTRADLSLWLRPVRPAKRSWLRRSTRCAGRPCFLALPARPYPAGLYSICIAPLACVLSAHQPLPSIPITRDCVPTDLAGQARSRSGRRGCS
eukprot:scaffold52959_cov59-Phaeocystis_antarctica.AAC.12